MHKGWQFRQGRLTFEKMLLLLITTVDPDEWIITWDYPVSRSRVDEFCCYLLLLPYNYLNIIITTLMSERGMLTREPNHPDDGDDDICVWRL